MEPAPVIEAYKAAAVAQRSHPDHEEPLFPDLVETLDRLEAAGHLLGIATGKARRGLNYTLASHGLTGRFVTLQTRSEERRVGKSVSVRVDLGGRRIINKKKQKEHTQNR